jgi:hypothetical protein
MADTKEGTTLKLFTTNVNVFNSDPNGFDGSDERLQHVVKVPVKIDETSRSGSRKTTSANNALLIDLREFPENFDVTKAIRDCELLKDLLGSKPQAIGQLVKAVKRGLPPKAIIKGSQRC